MSYDDGARALAPVQADGGATPHAGVPELAARGVAGACGPLPHAERIQAAFGRHDVGGVRAQVGGPAADASAAIGAQAYATGDRVAFAQSPDLHTAAHEAAHVVQQRAGVQLKGGVGRAGDRYERHADAVADRVVAGESAEGLLDTMAGGGATAPGIPRASAVQRLPLLGHVGGHLRRPSQQRRRTDALLAKARLHLDPILATKTGWQLLEHYRAPTVMTTLAKMAGDPELEGAERRVVQEHLTKRYSPRSVQAMLAMLAAGRLNQATFARFDARHWARTVGAVDTSLAAAAQLQTNRMMQQAWIDEDLTSRVAGAVLRFFKGEAALAAKDLDGVRAAAVRVRTLVAAGSHDAAPTALGAYGDALRRFTARYETYFQRLEGAAQTAIGVSTVVVGASALILGGAVVAQVGVAVAAKGLVSAAGHLGRAFAAIQTAVTAKRVAQLAATVAAALASSGLKEKLAALLARVKDLPPGGSAGVTVNVGPVLAAMATTLPLGKLTQLLTALGKKVPSKRARALAGTITADAPLSLSVSVSDSHTYVATAGGGVSISAGGTVAGNGSYALSASGEHIELPKAIAAMSDQLASTLPSPVAALFRAIFGHAAAPAGATRVTEHAFGAGIGATAKPAPRRPGQDKTSAASGGVAGALYARDVRAGEARSASREINVAASLSHQVNLSGVGVGVSLSGTYQSIVRDLNWDNNGEYFNLGLELEVRPFQRALKLGADAQKIKARVRERLAVLSQIEKQVGPAYANLQKQLGAKIAPLVAKMRAGGMLKQSEMNRLFKGYQGGRGLDGGVRWPELQANAIAQRLAHSRKAIEKRVARDLDRLDKASALDVAVTVGVDHYFTKGSPGGWALLYQRVSAGLGVDSPTLTGKKKGAAKKGRKKRGAGGSGHSAAVTAPVYEDIGVGAVNYIKQRFMRDRVGGAVWRDPKSKTALTRRPWWDAFVTQHAARLHEAFGVMWAERQGTRAPVFGGDFHGVGEAYGGPSPKGRFEAARDKLERVFMAELELRQDGRLNADVAEAGRLLEAGKVETARSRLAPHEVGRVGAVAGAILSAATAKKVMALLR